MKQAFNFSLLIVAATLFAVFFGSCKKENFYENSLNRDESSIQTSVVDRDGGDISMPVINWVQQNPESRLKKLFDTPSGLWGINVSNAVYRKENNDWVPRNSGSNLIKIVTTITSTGAEVWGINEDNRVYRWMNPDWVLSNANSRLKNIIQCGPNIYGINPDNYVYCWQYNNWVEIYHNVPMKLLANDNYANSSTHLWGIGLDNQVYRRYTGEPFTGWLPTNQGSKLKKLVWSNYLWGINPDNKVYRWENNDWVLRSPGSSLVKIIHAGGNTWGINSGNAVYRWENNDWVLRNAGSSLSEIYPLAPNAVWGISPAGRPYKWVAGDWIPYSLPGGNVAVQLEASGNRVWAIDEQNHVWTLMSEMLPLN